LRINIISEEKEIRIFAHLREFHIADTNYNKNSVYQKRKNCFFYMNSYIKEPSPFPLANG
jgi:hypothetical protein